MPGGGGTGLPRRPAHPDQKAGFAGRRAIEVSTEPVPAPCRPGHVAGMSSLVAAWEDGRVTGMTSPIVPRDDDTGTPDDAGSALSELLRRPVSDSLVSSLRRAFADDPVGDAWLTIALNDPSDGNMGMLEQRLRALPDSVQSSLPTHSHLARPSSFTLLSAQQAVWDEVRRIWEGRAEGILPRVYITGPSGIGKTAVAGFIAEELRKEGVQTFWASGHSEEEVRRYYAEFTENSGIASTQPDVKFPEWLEKLSSPYLLVLDDVDLDPRELAPLLPTPSSHGFVLITSRSFPESPDGARVFRLKGATQADVASLLGLPPPPRGGLTEAAFSSIADSLGDSPSQLVHLLEQIRSGRLSLETYLRDIHPLATAALAASMQGKYAQALEAYEDLYRRQSEVLGEWDELTIATYANLASIHLVLGNLDQAKSSLVDLIPKMEEVLGPDDIRTLATRSNYARLLAETGDLAASVLVLEGLVADGARRWGPHEPVVLTARAMLADRWGEAGSPDRAVEELSGLIPEFSSTLGPAHPDTLTAKANLARWTGESGDASRARDELRALLPALTEALGPEHPDTLLAQTELARWTGASGDLKGAKELLLQTLPGISASFGINSPHTVAAVAQTANWADEAGDSRIRTILKSIGTSLPDLLFASFGVGIISPDVISAIVKVLMDARDEGRIRADTKGSE